MTESMKWRDRLARWMWPLPTLELDEAKTALLVLDMQNYGANPESDRGRLMTERSPDIAKAYFSRLRDTVIPNQIRLLEFWRRNKLRVIYLTAGALLPDGSDMTPRRRRRDTARIAALGKTGHMHPRAAEYQILDELQPQPGELVIPKNSIGAFSSTAIDQILRNMGISGLVIIGVSTEACVESTARDAADRGYECILVEDGCASDFGLDSHEASLISFARMFGLVNSTDEVLERFGANLPQKPV